MPPIATMKLTAHNKGVVRLGLLTALVLFPGLTVSEPLKEFIPHRNLSIPASEQLTPGWKKLWDEARAQVGRGNTKQAITSYDQLFDQRPQLEQASWEYCQLLRSVGDNKTASRVISGLLQRKPNNIEYIFVGGAVSLANQDWPAASKLFARFLEAEPVGDRADQAMIGLMESLRGQGRRELALAIAEGLLIRRPGDGQLLKETAEEARTLGQIDKAKRLLRQIAILPEIADKLLTEVISFFDSPEFSRENDVLRERYLQRHPGFLAYRQVLVSHYLESERYEDALHHLYILAEEKDDNAAYLLLAGRIAFLHGKRPDKALSYFERYLKKYPHEKEVLAELETIRRNLAEDFSTIVENDGARLLWQDLTKLTSKREEIFKQLADILEKKGAAKEFFEVLSILNEHHPEEEEIGLRLAQLHYSQGRYDQARKIIDRLDPLKSRNSSLYLWRSKIFLASGEAMEALVAMEGALQLVPDNHLIRRQAMLLAGRLGDLPRLRDLFETTNQRPGKGDSVGDYVLLYLQQLSDNHLYDEFQGIVNRYRLEIEKHPKIRDTIDILLAGNLDKQDKVYQGEQVLRTMLLEGRDPARVLLQLAERALIDGVVDDAQAWRNFLEVAEKNTGRLLSEDQRLQALLFDVRLKRAQGDLEQAKQLLDEIEKSQLPSASSALFALERGWLRWVEGDKRGAIELLLEMPSEAKVIGDFYLLLALCDNGQHHQEAAHEAAMFMELPPETRLQLLPEIIEGLLRHQKYDLAQTYLRQLLAFNGESVLARSLQAKIAITRGQHEKAKGYLRWLVKRYPEEKHFLGMLLNLALKTGDYGNGLALWQSCYGAFDNVLPAESPTQARANHDFEARLTLARLLWGAKQQEKSLEVYRILLFPTVEKLIEEGFRQRQIAYPEPHGEKRWWETLLRLVQSTPDVVSQLMQAEVFLGNIDNQVSAIVTERFALYHGQKSILGEYQARKAIVERNYAAAELQSKRMVEEQQSPEGMIDLAAIYGRIGKYRKEAQVYEALQSTGTTSPEIQASMERSTQQLSPQHSIDIAHQDKQGRDEKVDLQSTTLGSSFRITPNLDSELFVSFANNRYTSSKLPAIANGNTLFINGIYDFSKDYEFHLGVGGEKMESDSNLTILHEMGIKGRLDQYFSALFEWRKGIVDDNVASLEAQTTYQQVEAGISCETPLGLTFGGDFRHRNYSDDNSQNRFHTFTAYGIYGDSIHISARYDYQYLANTNPENEKEERVSKDDSADALYWKPSFWSEHLWGVTFRQDFHGVGNGGDKRNSYYAVTNAVGFDDDDSLAYQGKFDIFLEISPHFLLKGNFTLNKGERYEEQGVACSLHYRW